MSTNINAREWFEKQVGTLTFAMHMRNLRALKDVSQVEMAKFLGMSKSALCDIEKGRQIVGPALAAKIAKKCNILL